MVVHKALFHTSQIIENFTFALGCYSEEAQESLRFYQFFASADDLADDLIRRRRSR